MAAARPAAAAAAAAWLAAPADAAPPVPAEQATALAWALKDAGYARLQRQGEPLEPVLQRLRQLQAGAGASAQEVGAAHDWLEGARAAMRGEAALAIERLDTARAALLAAGLTHAAAACQVPKLIALALLGRHDEAQACAERTHEELLAAGDEAGAGRVEINLGSMLLRQHRYADAARWYREAAVRFARVQDRRHSVMADIGLAGALAWQGEPDEAERIYERASARIRAHSLAGLAAVVHGSRGQLALRRGRHAEALRWLATALADREADHGADGAPQALAEARRELADAYLALNLLPEALALYEQAIAACRERQAPLEEAWATMQHALALARLGRNGEAAQGLAAARRLFAASGNGVGGARVASHLAELCLGAGAPQRALALSLQAADALGAAGMVGWGLEAELLQAQALAALGEHEAAAQAFSNVVAASAGRPEAALRAQLGLALLASGQGRTAEAARAFEVAATLAETQRAALQGDQLRIAYGSDKVAAFQGLVALALAEPAPPQRLFAAMERARAGALRDGVAPPAALADERRRELQWLQAAQQAATARGQAERAAELAARQQVLEAAVLEEQRRRQAAAPARAAPPAPADAAPALAEVLAALAGDEALVMYAVSGPKPVALVLRGGGAEVVALDATELATRVSQLRFQLDTLRFGAQALAAHGPQLIERCCHHLRRLHTQVWAPLAPLLQGVRRVVVLPQGPLHGVPFCALDDGEQALLDRHAIVFAPSAATWLARRRALAQPPRRAVVLGVAGEALPHVAEEAHRVAQAFGEADPGACTLLLDEAATRDSLRAALGQGLGEADLVHIACHGRFRADSPAFSALELADGPLTLADAAALPLAGLRVTLSACETAQGRIAPGDEVVGLTRGFLLAGARTVLSTHWTVDDRSTALLMEQFYRGLLAGWPDALALQVAQRTLRQDFPHPYHWAPYALHGAA